MLEEDRRAPTAVQVIIRLGRAMEKLDRLLDMDIFEELSKHNPYWDSDSEKDGEKLDDTRRKLSTIHDQLYEIAAIMKGSEDDGY